VLDHARERAIHGADVGHGRVAALLDVQDDPVAVALAGGQAEQNVEFDPAERQVPGDISLHDAYMHHACTWCQAGGMDTRSERGLRERFDVERPRAFRGRMRTTGPSFVPR
jgi:hypothetical protein